MANQDDAWRALLRQIRTAAPIISTELSRLSRRIPGRLEPGREANAYSEVHYYISPGLADEHIALMHLVGRLARLQQSQQSGHYVIRCRGFGRRGHGFLRPSRDLPVPNEWCADAAVGILRTLSGEESPSPAVEVPPLIGSVDRETLVVFICRSPEQIAWNKESHKRFVRKFPKSRTFWVYLNEGRMFFEPERDRARRVGEDLRTR